MTYMGVNKLHQFYLIIGALHDVYPPLLYGVVLLYLHGEDLFTFY